MNLTWIAAIENELRHLIGDLYMPIKDLWIKTATLSSFCWWWCFAIADETN